MAKWREIGEVPDSDEESLFDSEESQQQPTLPPPIQGNLSETSPTEAAIPQHDSIWDLPPSSAESIHLSHEKSVVEQKIEIHIPAKPIQWEPESSPLSSPGLSDEDVTNFDVRYSLNNEANAQEVLPIQQELVSEIVGGHISPVEAVEADDVITRQEAVRYGRSLRPRKPIQEHPYLLENAQYSTLFKSHGVRPVRLPAAAEKQQALEEDSQERDYEDDSQLTIGNANDTNTQETNDAVIRGSLGEERDELALSSPLRPSVTPRPYSLSQGLSDGSQHDDDLPSLGELFKKRMYRNSKSYSKRKGSPKQSSKLKTVKVREPVQDEEPSSSIDRPFKVFGIPPSPPQTSPAVTSATPATKASKARPKVNSLTPKPSSTNASRSPTPVPMALTLATVERLDLTGLESEGDAAHAGSSGINQNHATSSSPEPDTVFRRRIKGVLPASWIRLDQQLPHLKAQKPLRRSPDRSPEKVNRKGVAQRREVSPKPNNADSFLFDDESDDDTYLRSNDLPDLTVTREFSVFEDDDRSVVTEDSIDHMLPRRKRSNAERDHQSRTTIKKIKTQKTFDGKIGVRKRQQRITGMLNRSRSTTYGNKNSALSSASRPRPRHQRPIPKQVTPPKLSILDVIDNNAPRFIKIAARAASRQPNKGRSSPTRKQISLGTRQDNIDALTVLRNWENGNITSRSLSTLQAQSADSSQPLRTISDNRLSRLHQIQGEMAAKTVPISWFSRSRKLVKQTIIDGSVDIPPTDLVSTSPGFSNESRVPAQVAARHVGHSKPRSTASRPAQLETAGEEQVSLQAFHFRKKALDSMYRRVRKLRASAPETQLELAFKGRLSNPGLQPPIADLVNVGPESALSIRSRAGRRKLFRPRQIDTTAPQYARASDPLPEECVLVPTSLPLLQDTDEQNAKLLGLGPYGAYYTQHFEIFPLDNGVTFHKNTLIGEGRITKAFDDTHLSNFSPPRGPCLLTLGGRSLRWDQWDAHVSSEFGVLFDWIADNTELSPEATEIDGVPELTVIQAADFSLHYIQDILSLQDAENGRLFVHRILEVISGFSKRLALMGSQSLSLRRCLEVLPRVLLVVLQALHICGKLVMAEVLKMEELLKEIAQQTVRFLLQAGFADIRNLYKRLNDPITRSRDITADDFSVVAWTTLIRVLQESRIPRMSFWDVVSSVALESGISSTVDAQVFESLWDTLFSILPLGEFDNAGVVIENLRHTMPLEGWTLPQKILNRVFQIYKANQRQSPSFNDYCRALVGRCHYLVEQWGWRKCSSIIGTIFDFFASQNLSHLRNEESYKSAQFLEEIAGSPTLAIQPEDRCFHIFLKLIALTVQRLRRLGQIKDVRNLIARVLPNHDRQYLKESDIHENDLASLRNHHDLLCTLFWCSPQALRPSLQTLEKLVIPGSSHKEACLINLRAWNQLARFVISNGEDKTVYKPFADWQNNVFRQVLEQYSSVESEIQQQFFRMSKDASTAVSPELMDRIVSMNKQAATDVLHFLLRANLDVIRHAQSLATASMILNSYQLHEVFTRFSLTPPEFDWGTQSAGVELVNHYVGRVEDFMQHSGDSQSTTAWHGEDAIMVLDRHISVSFFSMAQNLVACSSDREPTATGERILYVEQTVVVASRLAALFLHHGVTRLSSFFSQGKYGLFKVQPSKLQLYQRRHLCLFVAVLIERGFNDFKTIDSTALELFLCAITKPFQALAYEHRLANALKRYGGSYFKDLIVPKGSPDYGVNRDSFDRTLFLMRRTLRFAAPNERPQLQQEFAKTLRCVMDQMKADLKITVDEASAHTPYMQFVRMIIPLIKKQDFCPVDNFFYQISSEYSPSTQDPRMQTAQIMSYGLKLEDGDTRSLSTLFYFLYSNFKLAMSNGKLDQERAILSNGFENSQIFSFMIGRMLPAVVRTSVRTPEAWLLLKTYVDSMEDLLDGVAGPEGPTRPRIHQAIGQENMDDLLALIKFVSAAINYLSTLGMRTLDVQHMSTLMQLVRLLNLFRPSLIAYLCLSENARSRIGKSLSKEIDSYTEFTRTAEEYMTGILQQALNSQNVLHVDPLRLFEEMQYYYVDPALHTNEHINDFCRHMADDMEKNWCLKESTMSIRGPPRSSTASTQSGQGTTVPMWDTRRVAYELQGQLREWNGAFDRSATMARRRRSVLHSVNMLF